ncbi:hypothetical protein JCM19235_5478 [Vibrio maritimus]|uniref:Uncharacterized protein n=1 Tax=Vibrio maritimus TaxID=990268 RepID=A0A090RRU6_9VIBR|nr:hypothetical protein JCM19235_5478 [Vibrio maritimus]
MAKWFPILTVMSLLVALIVGVAVYFTGMQVIVNTALDWKNSWFVIAVQSAWFFSCLFAAIYGLELLFAKAKLHFTSAA